MTATVLLAAALPCIAGQLPSSALGNDSAQLPSPVTASVLPETLTAVDRSLLLATDIQHMARAAAAASATDPQQSRIRTLLHRALALLGTPYRWGGETPETGFDCSGLVGYVFQDTLGIDLPRVSRDMAEAGTAIDDRDAITAGDLVFFGHGGRVDHVGIYVGQGRFVHAPRTGRNVTVSSMDSGYWDNKFMQARRVRGI